MSDYIDYEYCEHCGGFVSVDMDEYLQFTERTHVSGVCSQCNARSNIPVEAANVMVWDNRQLGADINYVESVRLKL